MSQRETGQEPPQSEPDVPHYARLPLLGAWAKFSVKLLLDSTLDLVLMPAALAAVALGILRGGDEPDRYFRALMLFGRRAERFVNLFGNRKAGSVDDVLGGYEQQVADEFERRGWSRKAEAVLRMPDRSTPSAARPPPPAANAAAANATDVNPADPHLPPPPPHAPPPEGENGPPRGPA